MSRRQKTDIPGDDWRVTLEGIREAGGLSGVFAGRVPFAMPLVVDIGFGRGEFLLALAEQSPTQAFVGIEYSGKRTLKMARRLAVRGLRNVALVESPAEAVLRDALPEASVSCFWLNFPDPWPKKRHHRRRFVNTETLARIAECLVPDGLLRIATDDPGYAEWIDEHLAAQCALYNCYQPRRWLGTVEERMPTAYELEWRALGRSFYFFEYCRRPTPG